MRHITFHQACGAALIGLGPTTGCTRFAINQRRAPPNGKTACGVAPLDAKVRSALMDAHRSEPPRSLVKAVVPIVTCPPTRLIRGMRCWGMCELAEAPAICEATKAISGVLKPPSMARAAMANPTVSGSRPSASDCKSGRSEDHQDDVHHGHRFATVTAPTRSSSYSFSSGGR